MNSPTPIVTDDRLKTQIKMAEVEKNKDLQLLLLELRHYRAIEKVTNENHS